MYLTSIKSAGLKLGLDVRMIDGHLHVSKLHPHPSTLNSSFYTFNSSLSSSPRPLWAQRLSSKSSFCRAVVQSGLLTQRQMVHAALRYRLGRSKDDAVIYWQIDQKGITHDGKLMWYGSDCHRLKNRNATWVMYLLKKHYGVPQDAFQPTHCFFGLHLLATYAAVRNTKSKQNQFSIINSQLSISQTIVCIVEAEKSAVILSELYPQYIWLAAGGMHELQINKFLPLKHYRVILFPDTDPDQRAYNTWYAAAQEVMNSFFWPRGNPIRVSPILELHATEDQKRRKIDLVDYLFENSHNSTF